MSIQSGFQARAFCAAAATSFGSSPKSCTAPGRSASPRQSSSSLLRSLYIRPLALVISPMEQAEPYFRQISRNARSPTPAIGARTAVRGNVMFPIFKFPFLLSHGQAEIPVLFFLSIAAKGANLPLFML